MGLLPRVENNGAKREEAIKNNIPVRFEIEKNSNQDFGSKLWDNLRTFESFGKNAVRKHDKKILKHSQKHNLDPDLVRSVMFAENARGHKGPLNYAFDVMKASDSPLPMNIQKERWASLIDKKPDDMYDLDNNIEAAAILLKRIAERIDRPTPEKVGSIWQYMGREQANEFGEYIGKVYHEKPWRKLD